MIRRTRSTAAEKLFAGSAGEQHSGAFRTLRNAITGLTHRRSDGMLPATDLVIALVFGGWLLAAVYAIRHLPGRHAPALLPFILVLVLARRFNLRQYASNSIISPSVVGKVVCTLLSGTRIDPSVSTCQSPGVISTGVFVLSQDPNA